MRYGKLDITIGPRSADLVRPPRYRAADKLPEELISEIQSAIQHGYTVETKAPRTVRMFGVSAAVTASIAIAVVVFTLGMLNKLSMLLIVVPWLFLFPAVSPDRIGNRSVYALRGRRVAGNGRASTELWRQALAEVDAGKRGEDELPALHAALLRVANAEDKVNRLVSKRRYELDQSQADLARVELAEALGEARKLMGLPALEAEPAPYLANRWAEAADLPESDPANPDQLR
jgi:hypothetical protein